MKKLFSKKNIVLLAVIVSGTVGGYFIFDWRGGHGATPTPIVGAPKPGPIEIYGEIVCLPKKGTGPQTLECAIGLRGDDGLYYGLKNLFQHDPKYKFLIGGLRVRVSGEFSFEKISVPGGLSVYDIAGVIDISSIEEDTGSGVRPDNSGVDGLESYPDLPTGDSIPMPASVNFVIEHRSALNGKTISIRGIVMGNWLNPARCPANAELLCPQPRVFLADSAGENKDRDFYYDLEIRVPEGESWTMYPVGKIVEVSGIVSGDKSAVFLEKK